MKYISKKDGWFKEGTECRLIDHIFVDHGLFNGIYIVGNSDYDKFWHNKGYKVGDEVNMNEICLYDEFDILCPACGSKIDETSHKGCRSGECAFCGSIAKNVI